MTDSTTVTASPATDGAPIFDGASARPLTAAQREIWVGQRLTDDATAYSTVLVARPRSRRFRRSPRRDERRDGRIAGGAGAVPGDRQR